MRRDTRHHNAARIKEINQSSFKKNNNKTWEQCYICKDWLYEETYFEATWYVGPTRYYPPNFGYAYGGNLPFHICNACCHTKLDVVDYLSDLCEKNEVLYKKSLETWEKTKKKKERKEALCIVDGKNYTFTFKETKEK